MKRSIRLAVLVISPAPAAFLAALPEVSADGAATQSSAKPVDSHTLEKAFKQEDIALLECRGRNTGEPAYAICAINLIRQCGPEEFLVGRPAEIRPRGRADHCGHAGI
jgi:hypothetical protein